MIQGIHHITAISSDPQATFDFYSGVLGLRLVKKTVNQDDTHTYHLFFGDKLGNPGMDLTFFTFNPSQNGLRGNGFVTKISLSVPEKSLQFWRKRFTAKQVKFEGGTDKNKIIFFDEDAQKLELVGLSDTKLSAEEDIWTTSEISKNEAIRSFYSATLSVEHISLVEPILLSVFGYTKITDEGNIHIYQIKDSLRGAFLEVEVDTDGEFGISGAGTVHHIAFRAKNTVEELELRNKLIHIGLKPTEVIDRYYFKSVYFRIPAGILFEIATDGPGFTADEKEPDLGKKLSLPPFLESQRGDIEKELNKINPI